LHASHRVKKLGDCDVCRTQ